MGVVRHVYRQLVYAMPTGQRASVAIRLGRLSRVLIRIVYPGGTPYMHKGLSSGQERLMFIRLIRRAGLRASHLHTGALLVINLCIAFWIRAKTLDQTERGNAERRALFVGLWPPMLWLIGDALDRQERESQRALGSLFGRGRFRP
jgi:hypothetical protein